MIELEQVDLYAFAEPGVLGEQVPATVSGVRLEAPNGTEVKYEELAGGMITFPEGNYTLSYAGEVKGANLQQVFDRPYRANVTVPAGYNVTNPLLGGYSRGANVTAQPDGTTRLSWESTREVQVRFYDATARVLPLVLRHDLGRGGDRAPLPVPDAAARPPRRGVTGPRLDRRARADHGVPEFSRGRIRSHPSRLWFRLPQTPVR